MQTIQTRVGDVTVIVTSPPSPDYPVWSWLTGTSTDLLLDDGWSLDSGAAIRRSLGSATGDASDAGIKARRRHYTPTTDLAVLQNMDPQPLCDYCQADGWIVLALDVVCFDHV